MSVMDALEAVYKANPEIAESMIDDIVLDVMADDAEANSALLNRAAGAVVSQRVAVAKRALLRQYASDISKGFYPSDEVHKAAEWLAGIQAYTVEVVTKASGFSLSSTGGGTDWEENKHPRGQGGRFVRGVNQGRRTSPLKHGTDVSRVHPSIRPRIAAAGGQLPQGTTPQQTERFERSQAQYEQADEILREFGAAFTPEERKKIDVFVQARVGDEIKSFGTNLASAARGMPDEFYTSTNGLDENADILSVQIDAGAGADDKLLGKVRQFNTMGAVGGQQLAALATLPKEKRDALTQSLMPRGPEQGRLNSLFGRFRAGADVLEHHGQDKLAGMARFMGEVGPEAETVLDPRVRQAAYRYRGTEKEPDILLMRQMNSPQMNQVEAAAREQGAGPLTDAVLEQASLQAVGRTGRGDQMRVMPPVEGSLKANLVRSRLDREPLTEDQLNMRVRSDVAAMHLLHTIPAEKMVAALSQKAGNVLPSQGVLIDADGDVVSQAVGVGDDTYLPFDYSNLKRSMKGGQYVRTRVQGGLTGEDITAAVGHGARMATVVSSSGVHSIEFDPNLRGTRAGSDKARSMGRRYIQILDAVENSGLYTQDIDPREKARLRSKAADITGTHEGQEFRDAYKRLEADARSKATQLTEDEMDGLMEQATTQVNSEPRLARLPPERKKRVIDEAYEELEQKASAEKASRLRLNAEGYQVALQTLQQQFPYFIRSVNYEPLAGTKGEPGFLDARGQRPESGLARQRLKATDEGYMRPGGTRANTVRSGFYRTDEAKPAMKEAISGTRFNEEQAAKRPPAPPGAAEGVSAAPPGTLGAPGAAPTPPGDGLSAPVGGPQGGLAAVAQQGANWAAQERDEALKQLVNTFGTLEAQRTNTQGQIASQPWEAVADQDNQQVAAWFLSQPQMQAKAALTDPAMSGRLATALADRKAVIGAFDQALNNTGGPEDLIQGGVTFNGQQLDRKQAAEWVADSALKVVDAGLTTTPFVNEREEGKARNYHKGTTPQALTINGTKVNDLDNDAKWGAFMQAYPKLGQLAREIGTAEGTDKFKPTAAVSQDVTERIEVLEALPRVVQAAHDDPGVKAGHQVDAGRIISGAGVQNPQKYLETLTRMNGGVTPQYGTDLKGLADRAKNADSEASQLQAAWALVNAGRVLAARGGGVGGPKVPNQGEIWKGEAASTRPEPSGLRWPEPRLQVVRKDASPLAKAIVERRRAGLPFVPHRVG